MCYCLGDVLNVITTARADNMVLFTSRWFVIVCSSDKLFEQTVLQSNAIKSQWNDSLIMVVGGWQRLDQCNYGLDKT